MSLFSPAFLDDVAALLAGDVAMRSVHQVCRLQQLLSDTVNGHDGATFGGHDGTLISYLRLDGSLSYMSSGAMAKAVDVVTTALRSKLYRSRHEVIFCYDNNPWRASKVLERSFAPTVAAIRHSPLRALEDLVVGRSVARLSENVRAETILIALVSPTAMTGKAAPNGQWSYGGRSVNRDELTAHYASVETIVKSLSTLFRCQLLSSRAALTELALMANPSPNADPVAMGQGLIGHLAATFAPRAELAKDGDPSGLLPYPIAELLFRDGFTPIPDNPSIIRHREMCYPAMSALTIPHPQKPFSDLIERMPKDIPFRLCLTIKGGHEAHLWRMRRQQSITKVFRFAGLRDNNNPKYLSITNLLSTVTKENPCVAAGLSLCTYAATPDQASSNRDRMMAAVEGWGDPLVGTPAEGMGALSVMNTLPGITTDFSGRYAYTDLHSLVYGLPIYRGVSPFPHGSINFISAKEKTVFPFAVGSSLQTSFGHFFYAEQGMGKSVSLAQLVWAVLFSGRSEAGELPPIAGIDVGPSARYMAEFIQQMAPAHMKHLVELYTVENSERFRNNPFDTLPGLRYPTEAERSRLISLLTLLFTFDEGAKEATRAIVSAIADEAYTFFDKVQPRRYRPGECVEVDYVLGLGVATEDNPTWYEVADAIFLSGYDQDSDSFNDHFEVAWVMAHRRAMPRLCDVLEVVGQMAAVRNTFADLKVDGNEVLRLLNAGITTARRNFAAMDGFTTFGTDLSRYVVLDLANVIPEQASTDPEERKIASAWFIWAANVTSKRFFMSEDTVDKLPDSPFVRFHRTRLRKSAMSLKLFLADECHRYLFLEPAFAVLDYQSRVSRKANVIPAYASQSLKDIPAKLLNLFANIWALTLAAEEDWQMLKAMMSLDEDVREGFSLHMRKPNAVDGSSLCWMGRIGDTPKRCVQFLKLPLPMEMAWACASTQEDAQVRKRMIQVMGGAEHAEEALTALAVVLNDVSAKKRLEQMMATTAGLNQNDAADQLVASVMTEWKQIQLRLSHGKR